MVRGENYLPHLRTSFEYGFGGRYIHVGRQCTFHGDQMGRNGDCLHLQSGGGLSVPTGLPGNDLHSPHPAVLC